MDGMGDIMIDMMEQFEELEREKSMINGIKPKITTTTKLGIKPTSFDGAMTKFCDKCKKHKPQIDYKGSKYCTWYCAKKGDK